MTRPDSTRRSSPRAPSRSPAPGRVRTAPANRDPIDPDSVPREPFSAIEQDFIAAWGRPRGVVMPEHVEILGQNGSGKSMFEREILLQRVAKRGPSTGVVVVCTKPADTTITSMGWPIISKWPPDYGHNQNIFWPNPGSKMGEEERIAYQRQKIGGLLHKLWVPDSNIIVVFDEIAYIEQELGLGKVLVRYYREARGLGITIVATTQRPQGVTRYMHSESHWRAFFAPTDEDDAERMAQVAGGKRRYLPLLESLNREAFEFLLVHKLTNQMVITWIDQPTPTPQKS